MALQTILVRKPSTRQAVVPEERVEPLVSIVVPVNNEESRLPECLNELNRFVRRYKYPTEVIIAEDGSNDKTVTIAKWYSSFAKHVKLVSSRRRLGKGGGLLHGISACRGQTIVYMDVDLSVPPDIIPRLIEAINRGYDVAIGSRLHPLSTVLFAPRHRVILGRLFNAIVRLLFNLPYVDTQVGFKAFRRSVLLHVLRFVNTDGFAFDLDLITKAERMGYIIAEIPIMWRHKEGSRVSPIKQAFRMLCDVIRIRLELLSYGHFRVRSQLEFKRFHDQLPGDVYWKALTSNFLPRRFWHASRLGNILNVLPNIRSWVADVGSGSGALATKIAAEHPDWSVVGIDVGLNMVKFSSAMAKRLGFENTYFIRADAAHCPLRDQNCGAVIFSEVLEYLLDPNSAIQEANRMLKDQGALVVTTPYVGLKWAIIRFLWSHARRERLEYPHFPLNLGRLKLLLSNAEFRVRMSRLLNLGCTLLVVARKDLH